MKQALPVLQEFDPSKVSLKGTCNRCGRCCVIEIEMAGRSRRFYCENLYIEAGAMIGLPKATVCRVFKKRYHDMPIDLIEPASGMRVQAICNEDGSPEEILPIITRGIGRGCSLEIVYGQRK